MKKLYYLIVLTLILGLVLSGCLLSNVGQVPTTEQSGISYLTKHTVDDPYATDLLAGQTLDVGDVLVWNDGDTLYVKYVIYEEGWCLTETHLAVVTDVNDFPTNKAGNPKVGHFPYQCSYNGSEWVFQIKEDGNADAGCDADDSPETCLTAITYTIPLDWVPDTELFIAAHAVVQKTTVITEAPYYASVVVDYSQGLTKGGDSVRWQRSTPEQGLKFETGQNEFNFFGLGFGGWIIVEFDCPIQNGEGDDIRIIEDTWGSYPLETAEVYASQDGTTWIFLGEADNTNPTGIHTISEFDLGILNWAKYIKIEDTCDPILHNNAADGYDLNAVESLQDCVEIQEETAWAAGLDFPGKNWATFFNYYIQPPLTLSLYEKDPVTWIEVPGGAWGELEYYPFGSTFDFVFNGHGLVSGWDYTLIYYPDPWPGTGLICLGSGIADGSGDVSFAASVNTGDLPAIGDDNYPGGAKIWLVLSDDIDCGVSFKNVWNPTEYLFEHNLITFNDTDV